MRQQTCHTLLPLMATIFGLIPWPPTANAANILGLFAHPSESHFAVMRGVAMELARRDHNVTVYSSHRLNERVENLQEVIIEPEYPFWHELQRAAGVSSAGGLLALSQRTSSQLQQSLAVVGYAALDYYLSNGAVRDLLQTPLDAFAYDLIIVDLFYTESLLALAHFHNHTPTIGVVSTNFEDYMLHVQESLVPVACSPIDFAAFDRTAGFWTRLANTRRCMDRRRQFKYGNIAAQERLIRKHFAHFKAPMPDIAELYSNLDVVLLNDHPPLVTPRPLLPNTIYAGGLHIRRPRELPWHILRFLDEARTGVIYMNLGNEQLCADLPPDTRRTLFKVFGERRERVLWTCHDVQALEGLPGTMMLQHSVPQSDILAHPHVKAFVMNGDLLSLQEGIVRHVPMLGLPIFRNELANMETAVRLGVGLKLDYANLTEASLSWALETLLLDSEFQLRIRKASTAFRDRPLGALETAMFWVEYLLRHKGGAAIRTRGIGIPSNQLHLFDLFVFYFGMALLIVGVLVGVYLAGIVLWRRRLQVEKVFTKLN